MTRHRLFFSSFYRLFSLTFTDFLTDFLHPHNPLRHGRKLLLPTLYTHVLPLPFPSLLTSINT
jgi:hypothetical protein